jgi:hypothetical protein
MNLIILQQTHARNYNWQYIDLICFVESKEDNKKDASSVFKKNQLFDGLSYEWSCDTII